MLPAPRRLILAIAVLAATCAPAHAQKICDDLAPFGLLPPAGGFTFGCTRQFNLKLGASIGPDGNYILLSYPSCGNGTCAGRTGTDLLACAAISGYDCCISTDQMVPTITGTNVGTLAAGLLQRIADDSDQSPGICHAEYSGNGSRIANVPLIQWIGTDRSQAQVTGFLSFFLVGPPTGSAQTTTFPVEFISDPTPTRGATWGRIKLLYR